MMLVACLLLYGIATAAIRAAQVGVIPYASLAMSGPAGTLTRATCSECLCAMFNSTGNTSILSLNCYANTPSSVTCDMFTWWTYLSSSNLGMVSNSSNRFYFVQLPPSVEVETTTAMTTGTSLRSSIECVPCRRFTFLAFQSNSSIRSVEIN